MRWSRVFASAFVRKLGYIAAVALVGALSYWWR